MALINPPLMVTGGTHPALSFRMHTRDVTGGREGVTQGDDLRVSALTVPGPAVVVGDGSAVIVGRAARHQGSYSAYNVGGATVPIAPTGATGRNDLLVLRVQDPEFEGNIDVTTGQVVHWDVISGVPEWPGTFRAPGQSARAFMWDSMAGMSAIPLAQIRLPPNTSVITGAMITDLRNVAQPRRQSRVDIGQAQAADEMPWVEPGIWSDWPGFAQWRDVWIPEWAVYCRAILQLQGVTTNGAPFQGALAWHLGNVQSAFVSTETYASAGTRIDVSAADSIWVPESMRGTIQTFGARVTRWNGSAHGNLKVDQGTSGWIDVDFEEDLL